MKTGKSAYKCGQCGYTSLKIVDLHEHLLDHSGSVGYFYDISEKTAFPKRKYDGSLDKLSVYTQTKERVSIREHKTSENFEIKNEDSTIVKTELFHVDIDHQNDLESTSREDISDNGFEFYRENPAFNQVLDISDHDYSKPEGISIEELHTSDHPGIDSVDSKMVKTEIFGVDIDHHKDNHLYTLHFNNVCEKSMFGCKKKPKKQNKRKQPKRAQRKKNKICTAEKADIKSQSVVSVQSEDMNEEEDHFPTDYLTATDTIAEADRSDGNNVSVDKCKKPVDDELHKVCEVCGIEFTSRRAWKQHRTSCKIKKHQCNICDKRFLHPWMLREHLLIHSGECPKVCDQCGKAFRTQKCLNVHLRRAHTKEKNFKCDQCGKLFTLQSHLTKHLRIHNNVLDYNCQFCGKKFSTNWNLKAHMRQHTRNKPYRCSICGESFAHNVSRKGHEAKCVFTPKSDNM